MPMVSLSITLNKVHTLFNCLLHGACLFWQSGDVVTTAYAEIAVKHNIAAAILYLVLIKGEVAI